MGLKKKLRAGRDSFHSAVANAVTPAMRRLGRRLRLRPRIRLLNRWGTTHPKTAATVFAAIMAVNIAVGVVISPGKGVASPDLAGIVSVSGMTCGNRHIDALAAQTRERIEAITSDANRSQQTLDSLLALPVINADDSARIAAEYRKLSTYAKMLSNEQD